MLSGYLYNLQRAVEAEHGCACTHSGTMFVHEKVAGITVWRGSVDTFDLEGHPQASKAFAWMTRDDGDVRYVVMLNLPPIKTPRDAIRAAIDSGGRQ